MAMNMHPRSPALVKHRLASTGPVHISSMQIIIMHIGWKVQQFVLRPWGQHAMAAHNVQDRHPDPYKGRVLVHILA